MVHPTSIRSAYEQYGSRAYYRVHGHDYRNPHEAAIRQTVTAALDHWSLDLSHVLDLACGSGEVTLALREAGAERVIGIDPFTGDAYLRRTGQRAESLLFEDVAQGALDDREYSLIVCSFALHLIESSRLPALMYRLCAIAPRLLIITPHKRPQLGEDWGWRLVGERVRKRVRARLYDSTDHAEQTGV